MTLTEKHIIQHLLMELERANGQFRQKLRRQYPSLTAYDIRLCTYLRAHLSTKEIAVLLNITPDSVKKAKHRLRKKMAISPDERIVSKFQNLFKAQ